MRKLLWLTVFVALSIFIFGDLIYLADGTKLTGKILNYGPTEVEILLETGQTVRVQKAQIVRIDPLDSALLAPTAAVPVANMANVAVGSAVQSLPSYPAYSVAGIPEATGAIPVAEIPVMYGDPEIEMRKRLLMYSEMKKEAWVAAELSLLIPSAGHLYTGEWERGFLFLGAKVAFGGVGIWGLLQVEKIDSSGNPVLDANGDPIMEPNNATLGALGVGGFALFALLEFVDAYYAAERYNQVLRLRLGIEQFDPMMLPTFSK